MGCYEKAMPRMDPRHGSVNLELNRYQKGEDLSDTWKSG